MTSEDVFVETSELAALSYSPSSVSSIYSDEMARIVQSEIESGFLDQLEARSPTAAAVEAGEDDGELDYSMRVKKELELAIKVRRMISGKSVVPEAEPETTKPVETSQETKKMQQERKERNRIAARLCRMKRRHTERLQMERLRQLEQEIDRLSKRAKKFEQLYRQSLSSLPTQSDFQTYLKTNPHLVRDPMVKPVLRAFVTEDYPKMPQYVMMRLVPASTRMSQ